MQTSLTNDSKMSVNQKLVRTAGLGVFGAIAIAMIASSAIPAAEVYAEHNNVGHDHKRTVGECYRAEPDNKASCQDSKDFFQEFREASRGPPNGGAADGDPANDVAGPATPKDPLG